MTNRSLLGRRMIHIDVEERDLLNVRLRERGWDLSHYHAHTRPLGEVFRNSFGRRCVMA